MKTNFTIFIALFSLGIFAQEAGKVGELIKNEAKSTEMQTEQASRRPIKDGAQAINGKRPKSNPRIPKKNTDYRWNYNSENSEVFLRIPEDGRYSVEIDDQTMSNGSGKFRFFDLRAGKVSIAIYEDNFLIYRTRLLLKNNTRTVLDFFSDYGLYLLGNYPLPKQAYGFKDWDDVWNNPYGTQGNYGNPGNFSNQGHQSYYPNVMTDNEFSQFIKAVKRDATFDDGKIAMVLNVAKHSSFRADQIYELTNIMSFDKGKLQLAKQLYIICIDKQNFYHVYQAFSFDSSKRELSDFILKY